jgi:nucleoid DNA-binding protein
MNNINFHIAYLLTKHECVIIPDLGAFVVSSLPALKNKDAGVFYPPSRILGFNPEIRHNDGLLANSLCLEKGISYKEAGLLIKQYTHRINEQLNANQSVEILWLGNLSLSSEHKIIFTPTSHSSCNALNFGLNNFYLPYLKELEESKIVQEQKHPDGLILLPVDRRFFRWTGSVAAAVLALLLVSTPLNNSGNDVFKLQNASLWVSTPVNSLPVVEEEANSFTTNDLPAPNVLDSIETTIDPGSVTNTKRYYIVISSMPTKVLAEKRLQNIKEEFPQAAITSEADKHRIYVNGFDNKELAQSFLKKFKAAHPNHSDAWLLCQGRKSNKN